jgi:outer membrane biosynthesis protein TonB
MSMLLLMMVAAAASQAQPTAAVSPDAKGLQTVGDAIKWMQDHPKEASALAIKPVARPLGYPGQWIRPDDYPPTALRQNVEGNTEFRLSVDRLGKPVACTILISSGSGILDDATCI